MRAIDADALKEVLQRYFNLYHVQCGNLIGQGLQKAIKSCIDLLDNAPTIDPESLRPQGEWIDEGEVYRLELHSYQCSNCKQEEMMFPYRKTDYCPNCGARMKGAGENEDE